MITHKERRIQEKRRLNLKIWKALNIEKVVKTFGLASVRSSIGNWLRSQSDLAKAERMKIELEKKLAEINAKL